jgi:hypothetical protein
MVVGIIYVNVVHQVPLASLLPMRLLQRCLKETASNQKQQDIEAMLNMFIGFDIFVALTFPRRGLCD